ncbi:hypothetical protein [Nocardia sp. NPDC019395]|uniref:hypothetical protein n=1 Tax=Nocardia sp. NPDC019395 TaxID=3154686 RepID=UPI0033D13C12
MNAPASGPIFDVFAVLNGAVDLRSYPRRNLVLSSSPSGDFVFGRAGVERAVFEPVVHLANGIEWLESQGWELVTVVDRGINGGGVLFAFMRRT